MSVHIMLALSCSLQVQKGLNTSLVKSVSKCMILCHLGVSDLEREDADKGMARKYALLVADTVAVPSEGQASPEKEKESILTNSCQKNWTDVAYFFKVWQPSRSLQPSPEIMIMSISGIHSHPTAVSACKA